MSRVTKAAAIAGILVLLAAACGPAATPTSTPRPTATLQPQPTATPTPPSPRLGGTLRPFASNPIGLDAHGGYARDEIYDNLIYDTLLRLDENLKVIPGLAESWDSVSPTTLVMKLKKGVKFQDGTDLNAQVAKWNLDRILNPETKSPTCRAAISELASVEVVDDSTLRLNFKKPSYVTFTALGTYCSGLVSPAAVQKWGDQFGIHPVGTGPFAFGEWVPDSHVRLQKNANFWGKPKPYLDTIEFRIIADPAVQLASLLTGAVDMGELTLPEHISTAKKSPGIKTYSKAGEDAYTVWLNHQYPFISNLDFRKALDTGLDREQLAQIVFKGEAAPIATSVSDAFSEYNRSLSPVKQDVAKAKELLAKSGYKGEEIVFSTYSGIATFPALSQAIQAQWEEIGVKTKLRVHGSTYGADLTKLDYVIAQGFTREFPLDQRVQRWFHSAGSFNNGKRYGGNPAQARIDQLIDQISGSIDPAVRKPLWDELQKVMYENVMELFIVGSVRYMATRDRVQNFAWYLGKVWYRDLWVTD